MRKTLLLVVVSACSWTTFDDLSNQTWVHSEDKPEIGSTDYGVAIVGVTTDSSGGKLAVLSNDSPTYSTLVYDAHGGTSIGSNTQQLGQHFIASLGEQPLLVTDGAGKIAVVAAATSAGSIAVFSGPADQPADLPFSSATPPDAATFAGGKLVIAAGSGLYVVDAAGGVTACNAVDATSAQIQAAALSADDKSVWVWTKTGALFGYSIATLGTTCAMAPTSPPNISPSTTTFTTTGFVPGAGAKISVIGTSASATEFAILAAHADKSTTGQVFVVNLKASPLAAVGTPLSADDLVSSAVGALGPGAATTYAALGFPDRVVNGTTTGQVELHAFDPTTGVLTSDPAALLNDAQPDGNELFGRALATLQFNGAMILVVAANSEVFSYYRTTLYPDTRP